MQTADSLGPPVDDGGWIYSRSFDLGFFYGGSAVAAALGVLVLLVPSLLVPLIWLWMLLVEGPHLLATYQRTYFDRQERAHKRRLLHASWLWFLPPLGIWAAHELTGEAWLFEGLLGAAALWAYHHGVRQNYGITAIYEARAGAPRGLWRFDKWVLTALLWAVFAWSVAALEGNHQMLGLDATDPLMGTLLQVGAWSTGIVVLVLTLALLGSLIYRRRSGLSLKPAMFALGPVVALSLFTSMVIGPFEPVFTEPKTSEQLLLAMTLVGGLMHGVHYLGITTATTLRRYRRDEADDSWSAKLGRAPVWAWLLMSAVSVAYVLLDAGTAAHPGIDLLARDSSGARLCLALYWGLFFHHYYLDQRIWRVRGDDRLREELGLEKRA